MREKIIFIDFLITVILSLLIISCKTSGIYCIDPMFLGIILYYYSIAKSIFGIIIFVKNIFQNNIVIIFNKILFLFIPSLILSMYITYNFVEHSIRNYWNIHYWDFELRSIIMIPGMIALLSYLILNKTLIIKNSYKIILAIILPVSFFFGYWMTRAVVLA
jgi:hypothetical protein